MRRDGLDVGRNPSARGGVKSSDGQNHRWNRSHAVNSKPKVKIGPSVKENPSAPGQSSAPLVILSGAGTSRSEVPAESKDPYPSRARRSVSRVPHPNVAPSATLGWDSTAA